MYFREITQKIASQLEKQIFDFQERMGSTNQNKLTEDRNGLREFSMQEQWKSQNLYENMLSSFIQLIDAKIGHWDGLMSGYKDLNPFQENTQKLCQLFVEQRERMLDRVNIPEEWFDRKTAGSLTRTHSDLNLNLLTLRLYSIYFTVIINDFERSMSAENFISDLIQNDRQKEQDVIDNHSILMDTTTIMLVSIVKNKGKITNKNQTALGLYFGYDNERDFKSRITSIHELLPKQMQAKHNQQIENFIQRGYSEYFVKKLQGLYVEKNGYLKKAYVKLGNLFQERDDYVLTASLLKCNTSNELLSIDGSGKILGISQLFFENLRKICPSLTLSVLIEDCPIWMIFPQVFFTVRANQVRVNEVNQTFIADENLQFYVPENLTELIKEYQNSAIYTEIEGNEQSINLSSWRSWKTFNRREREDREKHAQEENDGCPSILGFRMGMLHPDKLRLIQEFLLSKKAYFEEYQIMRMKTNVIFRGFQVKTNKWAYFVFELEHPQILKDTSRVFQKMPSMNKIISLTFQQLNEWTTQKSQLQDTLGYSEAISKLQATSHLNTELNKSEMAVDDQDSEEDKKRDRLQRKKTDTPSENSITKKNKKQVIMLSAKNIAFPPLSKTDRQAMPDESQIIFKDESVIPIVNHQQQDLQDMVDMNNSKFWNPPKIEMEDEFEFLQIDRHFAEIQEINNIKKQQQFLNNDNGSNDSGNHLDVQNQAGVQHDDSSYKMNRDQKENLIDIIKTNKQNNNQQEEEHHHSQASSQKTSTSKSPFLLVRSIYQIGAAKGGALTLFISTGMMLSILFVSLFIKMSLISSNYSILQSNIYFVQFPETLNFYFLKTTMMAWLRIEEGTGLAVYSDFTNQQVNDELSNIREVIDVQLNSLYKSIIQYEDKVLSTSLPFYNVNNLNSVKQNLDLTQLIEHLTLHSFSFIDDNKHEPQNKTILNPTSVTDLLFFRLNLPTIYKFATSYITLLNDNLLYYEDKIIQDIILIVMALFAIFTLIALYQVFIFYKINLYEQRILMLLSRVSMQEAERMISILREVKQILSEPSQITWKKINYFDFSYSRVQTQGQLRKINQIESIRSSMQSKFTSRQTQSHNSNSKGKQGTGKQRSYQSNSLAQRIYDLKLSSTQNYIILIIIWLIILLFFSGTIIVTDNQVSQIKPTLNLNLQIIRFKLQFDSMIVQAEILKTQRLIQNHLIQQFSTINANFDNQEILSLFLQNYQGFQQYMTDIYNQLASSNGLLQAQKDEMLRYFEQNLCTFMAEEIPFCEVGQLDPTQIPQSFIDKYGKPDINDNNYEYISGGIVNMVHEFVKTIIIYYSQEILGVLPEEDWSTVQSFLQTNAHVTQFVEYYTDQGKLLSTIGYDLLRQNQDKLQGAVQAMGYYVYITGVLLTFILIIVEVFWLKRLKTRLELMKLSLTLIPYEVLMEPKTVSVLKTLNEV